MSIKEDHKFEELIEKYKDCPIEIFKLASTEWEKAVAVEFFMVTKKQENIEHEIKWLKYLCKAVFGIGAIGVIIQIIPKLYGV